MEYDANAALALTITGGVQSVGSANTKSTLSGLLLSGINKPLTPMGVRLLRSYITKPLLDEEAILARQAFVGGFVGDALLRCQLRDSPERLKGLGDIDSPVKKLAVDPPTAKLSDLVSIYRSLVRVQAVCGSLAESDTFGPSHDFVQRMVAKLAELKNFFGLVEAIVDVDQLAKAWKERELWREERFRVKSTYSNTLSDLSKQVQQAKQAIMAYHTKLSSTVGLKKQKNGKDVSLVSFERTDQVGLHFRITSKQAAGSLKKIKDSGVIVNLLSASRLNSGTLFVTDKFVALVRTYDDLSARYAAAQEPVVAEAVRVAGTYHGALTALARMVAEVDAAAALGAVAAVNDWTAPTFLRAEEGAGVAITGLRHPVVEALIGCNYVPSDVELLSTRGGKVAVVTGLNMGGKSTLIRAVGLCAILAQMGSYVPATSARLSLFDQVITRVGACDSTRRGLSTFMAEMLDVASALGRATERSLVIVDELGRGTSTHEGFGLAWAVLERFASTLKSTVLFATHFHELTEMADRMDGIVNYHVKADVRDYDDGSGGERITMLYKLFPGPSKKSYGVAIARLCNFPSEIVAEAEETMRRFEAEGGDGAEPVAKKAKTAAS